ncbi:MAG TPA: two-component regulator propeller domain-containing protein [Chryseosolibacter sp.]
MLLSANLNRFCLLALFMTLAIRSLSQQLPEEVLFEQVSIPGTIRSSQVTNIIQDELGLMWLAGHGLYRYDGFRFRQYKELGDGQGLFSPYDILTLLNDRTQQRILLGTRRFGIVQYDYREDKLLPFTTVDHPPIINFLAQTESGNVWAGSYNSGLYSLDKDSLVTHSNLEKIAHPSSLITKGETLYVGEHGVVYIVEKNKIKDEIHIAWEGKNLTAYNQITALTFDKTGNLWIGTEKQGVLVYNLPDKKFIKYFPPSAAPFFSKISKIYQDRDGLIWILTKASGLVIYNPATDEMKRLMKDPFSQKSISSDNCFSIAEDKQGIIWIGATGDVNKYDRQQIKFQHILHNPLSKLSITDNMVRGVCEDYEQKLWIGTDGGFINIIDLKNQRVEAIDVTLPGDSANYVPMYFAELDDRYMLVGTSHGLLQYDRRTKTLGHYKPLKSVTEKRVVRQVLIDEKNIFFIYNGILYVHDRATGITDMYRKAGHDEAYNITVIELDDDGYLWVGSNKGVSRYNRQTKQFTFLPFVDIPVATDGSLLMALSIKKIGKKLFVGSFNAGLWEFDVSDMNSVPQPKRYSDADGLPSTTIYAALPGNDGNIWLSSNSGIVLFDQKSNKFIPFSISEGLQEEEFNRLAFTETRSGKLVFGGINGINIFDPSQVLIRNHEFVPKILSATFTNPLAKNPSRERFSSFDEPLSVKSYQNFADFHFFVPYFKQPKRFNLLYKLENFDQEWKEVNTENSVSYANLPPGSYTFHVKTISLEGREQETQVALTISPPYWQTWWFILLSLLVVAFFVMTIIRSYIRKAQYDRQRLEILLKLRTAEIERSKEELQILNQKKDLIFSILSHDLRSPLTTLKGFLGFLISHAHELSTDELKRHAVNIKNSVTNSLDLIDNTLFWSLSQMGNIHYTPTDFSLTNLIVKLKGLYQLTADKKRIPLTVDCDEEIFVHGDENMIYVTLRNLVSNALKFTSEGNPVSINCVTKDDYVEINIIDQGIGMSEEYLQRILSQDQPMLKKGTSNEKGTGLGLLLCKKFIDVNKGELIIKSKENVGTTFTVILPLAAQAVPSNV